MKSPLDQKSPPRAAHGPLRPAGRYLGHVQDLYRLSALPGRQSALLSRNMALSGKHRSWQGQRRTFLAHNIAFLRPTQTYSSLRPAKGTLRPIQGQLRPTRDTSEEHWALSGRCNAPLSRKGACLDRKKSLSEHHGDLTADIGAP